ncbi:MAG: ATP-binding protein [Actinomycetota bacterium]
MTTNGGREAPQATSPVERFIGAAPGPLGIALSIAFVIVVGIIDHLTGPGVSLAPFYLMPVVLATWTGGRAWGLAIAGMAALATRLADPADGTSVLVHSWNAIVWFLVLAAVVWLVDALEATVFSQRRRLDKETEVADDLRYQNDMKNTLLHAVSHDLKGPLAGVLGAMQTIRRADKLNLTDKEMEDLYGVIEQAGAKAARLVEDLLDLDRLDRGQLEPQREPTDVESIADRLSGELPTLAGHPVRVDGTRLLVSVDATMTERIIENLLNNAARHTPPGTPIHVGIEGEPHGIVVVVEDEGPGVPDAYKSTIFEPFEQGENARGGVGIGLSLVGRFAELHGGSAHVEDRDGGGARFVVTLPGDVVATPSPAPVDLQAV